MRPIDLYIWITVIFILTMVVIFVGLAEGKNENVTSIIKCRNNFLGYDIAGFSIGYHANLSADCRELAEKYFGHFIWNETK